MANLILLVAGQAKTYELKHGDNFLGRLPECDIQIDSNMVSRKHARVYPQDGRFYIEDLGSGNGSFVNGQRIAGPTMLKTDDRIKFGPILFRFEGDSSGSGASQAGVGEDSSATTGVTYHQDESSSTITDRIGGSAFDMLDVQPAAKLKAVLEITKSLAGTIDIDKILPKVLDTLFGIFPHADRGCVLLLDDRTQQMIPRAMKHRRADAQFALVDFHCDGMLCLERGSENHGLVAVVFQCLQSLKFTIQYAGSCSIPFSLLQRATNLVQYLLYNICYRMRRSSRSAVVVTELEF